MRLILLVFLQLALTAHASIDLGGPQNSSSAEIKQRAEEITARLIQTHLPELTAYGISIELGNSKQSVVKTMYGLGDMFNGPQKRQYRIILSLHYQANYPTWASLETVLLHELYHVLDYTRMSAAELRRFTFKLNVTKGKFVPRYEKCTDFRALQKSDGAENMLAYREWQQANMPAKYAAKKLRNYFTPNELREGSWRNFQDCPKEAVLE